MGNDKYFVISTGEDGTSIEAMDKEELLKRLDDKDHYGDKHIYKEKPSCIDTMYWNDSLLIIKGEIVTPTPVEVVKKWEVS